MGESANGTVTFGHIPKGTWGPLSGRVKPPVGAKTRHILFTLMFFSVDG